MSQMIDPALLGVVAYLAGVFTLSMLLEFLRALLWSAAFIYVLRRFGFTITRPRR